MSTISPNMNLVVSTIGVDSGLTWETNLNASLSIIDGHDHTPGRGFAIPPSGLNINSDLTFGSNNAIDMRTVRFSAQPAVLTNPADIDCIYVSGVDLYYNDGLGNNIQMTANGSVAGANGSIAGLTSPASATYVALSSTFVWQSNTNTPAYMDGASVILRNLSASSKGLTLNPPAAMAADFALTLPSLPVSGTKFMTMDSSGNIAATVDYPLTRAAMAPVGQQLSSSCGAFTSTSGSYVDVTNLTVSLTTTGRPVFIGVTADGTNNESDWIASASTSSTIALAKSYCQILEGATPIKVNTLTSSFLSGATIDNPLISAPTSTIWHMYVPSAGTYTYKIQVKSTVGTNTNFKYSKLIAYEL